MKKSTKAALLSAFVIPGAGHLLLKKKLIGGILVSVSLISVYFLVTTAIQQAFLITDKILNASIQPDITTITQLVTSQMSNADTTNTTIASTSFIIAWIIGLIDSYRRAKHLDQS